jgi:glutamyl-tRNA synthetase
MPNYLNLYDALDIMRPLIATVPHIMAPDGKKKLGKRDGAKDVLDYIRDGFMPETLISFIATLGWNDGTEQEVFTQDELIERFSLERVQRSGARFDEQRLLWMNGYYIRQLTLDDLFERVATYWPEEAKAYDDSYKKQVLALVQERLKFFAELPALTRFFFTEPTVGDDLFENNKQLKKLSSEERSQMLRKAYEILEVSDFSETDLEEKLRGLVETLNTKPGILFGLIRATITGSNTAPGLFETLHALSKERSLRRIKTLI